MEANFLAIEDLDVILESLAYSKMYIEDSQKHPTYEYKQQQIKRVTDVTQKVRELKKAMKV